MTSRLEIAVPAKSPTTAGATALIGAVSAREWALALPPVTATVRALALPPFTAPVWPLALPPFTATAGALALPPFTAPVWPLALPPFTGEGARRAEGGSTAESRYIPPPDRAPHVEAEIPVAVITARALALPPFTATSQALALPPFTAPARTLALPPFTGEGARRADGGGSAWSRDALINSTQAA